MGKLAAAKSLQALHEEHPNANCWCRWSESLENSEAGYCGNECRLKDTFDSSASIHARESHL